VAGGPDGRVWWWSGTGRLLRQTFLSAEAERYALALDKLSKLDLGTPPPRYKESVLALSFAPDGRALAALGRSGAVVLWDATTGKERGRLPGQDTRRRWLCFSPDPRTLAIGVGGAVELWDPEKRTLRATLGGRSDPPLLCGAYSAAGDWLAVGTEDQKVRVWDVRQGGEAATLPGHLDAVAAVAFSPDGRTLASGSHDRTVRLWNVATWQEVLSLHGHEGKVTALAFRPDGTALASGGEVEVGGGQVLIWRAPR
jgi:WD40 repeat protein